MIFCCAHDAIINAILWRGKFCDSCPCNYICCHRHSDTVTLFFCLFKENNAIAVVDLKIETIEDILPLGFKRWEKTGLDTSDTVKGISRLEYKGWRKMNHSNCTCIQAGEIIDCILESFYCLALYYLKCVSYK